MNLYYCYIIYSEKLDKFYIGETEDLEERLRFHNSGFFKNSFTSKTSDWTLIHSISCKSRRQARLIEKHIKEIKSRKYLLNLSKYPKMTDKLLVKYE